MRVILIRHGQTKWNETHKYIGHTDLPLSPKGCAQAQKLFESQSLPKPNKLLVSPLKRCRETADILFPDTHQTIIDDLRECDFGIFEGRSAIEMAGDPQYQSWVDSKCQAPIPGGESFPEVIARCVPAFVQALADMSDDQIPIFVVHGGTVMGLLTGLAKNLPDTLLIDNCSPLACDWDGKELTIVGSFIPQNGGQFPTD